MIRAVLDANVVVSGIVSGEGLPARILTAWREERFHLVTSPAILDEIGRVLRYPKIARYHRWSNPQVEEFLEGLAELAIVTSGKIRLSVISADPSDDRYIECAIESQAAYVVTGDKHLLKLGQYEGVEIITPRLFVELLK